MKTIVEIRARRDRLVAEAARQRSTLAHKCSSFQGPAAAVDRGLGALGWLRRHPLLVGAATAVLVAVRPRRALSLAGRGVLLWRTVRMIRGFLREAGMSS